MPMGRLWSSRHPLPHRGNPQKAAEGGGADDGAAVGILRRGNTDAATRKQRDGYPWGQGLCRSPACAWSGPHNPSHPHLFEYHVTIVNEGDVTFTILGRRWTIIDADGHIESVDGDGIIGQTPVLNPVKPSPTIASAPSRPLGNHGGGLSGYLPDGREFEILIDRFHLFECSS